MGDTDLTVIVPAYNEVATIEALLDAVAAAPFRKQVVVVDDGSRDGTAEAVAAWLERSSGQFLGCAVELIRHSQNRGKGAAIRTALASAQGRVTLVQDADLEYNPSDYPAIVGPVLAGTADVVYGSRYLQPQHQLPWTANRLCVLLLNTMVLALYGRRLTDEATCYKAFRTESLRRMDLCCERFEFCPEVTAKVCRMGLTLVEVAAQYSPRTTREGKKIGWRDGIEAIATLIRWRFASFRPTVSATVATTPAVGI